MLLTLDDDEQAEAVNLVGVKCPPSNVPTLLPLDMHNKKYEMDLKSKLDPKVDSEQKDPKVDSRKMDSEQKDPKVDSWKVNSAATDPKVDSRKVDSEQTDPKLDSPKLDYDNSSGQPKVDSKLTSSSARHQKMECAQTNKENRPSWSHKRSAASERCLVCLHATKSQNQSVLLVTQ